MAIFFQTVTETECNIVKKVVNTLISFLALFMPNLLLQVWESRTPSCEGHSGKHLATISLLSGGVLCFWAVCEVQIVSLGKLTVSGKYNGLYCDTPLVFLVKLAGCSHFRSHCIPYKQINISHRLRSVLFFDLPKALVN